MKKILVLLFCVLLIFTFIACSNPDSMPEGRAESIGETTQEDSNNKNNEDSQDAVYEDEVKLNQDFFKRNRSEFMKMIEDNSIVVLFADYPNEAHHYSPNRNLYYLTGIDREIFITVLTKKDGIVKEILFARQNLPEVDKWLGKMLTVPKALSISGIEETKPIENFQGYMHSVLKDFKNIYLDLGNYDIGKLETRGLSYTNENTPAVTFALNLRQSNPEVNILNSAPMIATLRRVKTKGEIENMKRAIEITGKGIENIMKNAKPGMMEYELASYFDFIVKHSGAKEYAFLNIAASGENATVLHYMSNDSQIEEGDLILFDLGAAYNYYCADISRTIPANGKFTERQKEIYNIVLKAQTETIKAIRPGITLRELQNVTRKVLVEELEKIKLIKDASEIINYYPHAVSHSLGLEAHDPGVYGVPLEPGMVITVEPGIYIEVEELGIRIEDDILITEDGYINLSKDIIKTVDEIEAFMGENQ